MNDPTNRSDGLSSQEKMGHFCPTDECPENACVHRPEFRDECWARAAKEALAYWRHSELGRTSGHTASAVLDDDREGADVPAWAMDLATWVLDFESATRIRVHDGQEYNRG